MKILVVEDNQIASLVLRRFLLQLGYHDITEATNGQEALRHLEWRHFEMVITDWMMPKLDGLTLVRRIRAREGRQKIPILMVTAKGLETDIYQAIDAGIDDYIVKPLRLDLLKAKIEKLRQQASERDSQPA